MLVALFDSELFCSPPSNRATKRLAYVGFVWQAYMGDEYDIIIIITTTATATATATTTTTTTTTTRSIKSTHGFRASTFRAVSARYARLHFARVPRVLFCAGSARVAAFKFLKEINILRRTLLLGNLYIITLGTLRYNLVNLDNLYLGNLGILREPLQCKCNLGKLEETLTI